MKLDAHVSLLSVRTPDELLQSLLKLAAEMDFGLLNASLGVEPPGKETEIACVANWAPGYEWLATESGRGRIDPVMQHLKCNSRPIAWDRQTYIRQGLVDLWEEQAPFGYQTGICTVLHLPHHEHFIFGVDRIESLPNDEAQRADLVARVQLLSIYAYEAAVRVLRPLYAPLVFLKLADRERECLQWTMEGKTAWEIGRILSLSERTVAGLLSGAMRKLECVNKQQAVVKALRLGLLDLH
jgi:DNA-binding CsgD family transcriptional regulator